MHLLACCDDKLCKDVHRSDKQLETLTERAVLAATRSLTVRQEDTMVSRVTLQGMSQDRDEVVHNFTARFRGQADVCCFTVRCSCNSPMDVNFTDQMICDMLIHGLVDLEILQKVLRHENQDMDLNTAVK